MHILIEAIVSNTEMMKNYKACREKAGKYGKIFVLKNNQPDSVLFSINEFEKLSVIIEHLENLEEKDIVEFSKSLLKNGKEKRPVYQ